MSRSKKNKKSGFTLIELIVVMAIIAILTTAGLFAYNNYLKGTRDSVRATMAQAIATKVEGYSGIHGAPIPGQVETLLTTEGIIVKDPLGGKPVCVDHTGESRMVCKINYHQFSDGTYAVSYGVEKSKNLINPHYSKKIGGAVVTNANEIYGSFIGNNPTLSVTPVNPTVLLEDKPDLNGISVDAGTLSSSGGYTNTVSSLLADGMACTTAAQCANGYCGLFECTDGTDGSPCNSDSECRGGSCVSFMGPGQCMTFTPI